MKLVLFNFLIFFSFSFSQSNNISKTKLYNLNENKYISALEYAEAQKIRTIFYDNKEKLEFRFQNHKLTISPHSSFIQINDNIYHMSLPVIFDGNDFFIPVDPFFNITNNIGMPRALIDSSEKYIIMDHPKYNIHGISIINKVNGSLLTGHGSIEGYKNNNSQSGLLHTKSESQIPKVL